MLLKCPSSCLSVFCEMNSGYFNVGSSMRNSQSEGHKVLEKHLSVIKCNNPVNECTFIYFDILPSNSISPLTRTSYT